MRVQRTNMRIAVHGEREGCDAMWVHELCTAALCLLAVSTDGTVLYVGCCTALRHRRYVGDEVCTRAGRV